ncbi:MAG: insulinase family protein [Tannerella sp.]|nr:insulinase family protein [Tannerella sp.]
MRISSSKARISTEVIEHILDNGLTVWLNEDSSQPKIFGAVVVKAGAKHCPDTGIAHYFEHIMFKGTDKIGTVDYASEKILLDTIAKKYDELAQTDNLGKRTSIQREINELSVEAAQYVIPNEFDRLISKYGGSKLNAGTSYDYTEYHNIFSPQYVAQWAEINSERLLNPVFRMFQSELETVYEEKNRMDDMMLHQAIEKISTIYFHPHPYAYPIIGSDENLKNPRLSEMRKFFEKYYVASNMGLILSGDFDTESVIPILERTFSRIPQGEIEPVTPVKIRSFKGREKAIIKVPIPLLKAIAFGFRGTPSNHPDQAALAIAVNILNNSNGTGYLDQLMVNRRLIGAIIGGESFNEAGFIGIVAVPKLVSQSHHAAEKLIWSQVNRLKNGDFTDDMFYSIKQEQLRKHFSELEDIDSRCKVLIRIFSQGKTWNDYLNDLKSADQLTKEDVIKVANSYFGDDYLYVRKRTGKYGKVKLKKPDFAPILPRHTDSTSEYAKWLETIPVQKEKPRFVDFEKDVRTIRLSDYATLYVTPNTVNRIFTFNLLYGIGVLEEPKLKYMSSYIPLLGTKTQTFDQFRTYLQTLGSTLDVDVNEHCFKVKISGFDNAFEETIEAAGDFLENVKADKNKLKTLVDDAKLSQQTFFKSNNEVAEALFEYVQYGVNSQYINKPSLKEIKKIKAQALVDLFFEIQKIECSLHYCGTLEASKVVDIVGRNLNIEQISRKSNSPVYREFVKYDKPLVFFYHISDVFQNIIYAYMSCDPQETLRKRHEANLFSRYFGEGMSSLMFQEIREFRSFAYYTSGAYRLPPFCRSDKPSRFIAYLSTQCDKTVDALDVLNSLIHKMPRYPEKIESAIHSAINHTNNNYPTFRDLSAKIDSCKREGYTEDPNLKLLDDFEKMQMEDVVRFYETNVKGRNLVYVIVGNSRKMDMRKLASFGDVIRVRKKDFYR